MKEKDLLTGEVTVEEVSDAENYWIRDMQIDLQKMNKFPQLKSQFAISTDKDGILRAKGRIQKAEIETKTKFPIVLPNQHYVAVLIARDAHERVFHNGVSDTMSYIREKFWILRLRQFLKGLIYRCVLCRRMEGKPYPVRPPPPLPEFRVVLSEPFSTTGVDFAGPLYIRCHAGETEKAYIALFSCAATRALHLELVPGQSSPAFIRCLQRFIGQRGAPHLVLSDNAKTFVAEDLKAFLRERRISWQFNLSKSPWRGGMYERMVRMTKRCLKKKLGKARVSYEELETVLIEIESVINNRPLTYVGDEIDKGPITPNHLIYGRKLLPVNHRGVLKEKHDIVLNNEKAVKRIQYTQHLINHFNQRWQKEYLLNLRQYHNLKVKENAKKRIQKNDMVLIHNDGPRLQWRLGKVKELLVSSDGEVRGAKIETVTPGYKSVVLERPLQLLYPLEVSAYEEKEVEQNGGRDAKELEQGDEKGNLARETTDRSGSKIAEEERMNDSYAESIEEIDEINSDSEKSSEDMINDCHSERFREEIEGDFELLDLPQTVTSKDKKFKRQRTKEKRTEEERRVDWLSGGSVFLGGKTQIVDPSP